MKKMKNTALEHFVSTIPQVLLGNAIYALAIKLFLLPAHLIVGGTTGISLIIQHLWGIPISGFIYIFNIIMLFVGFLIFGKRFALTTILSSVAYPTFLGIYNRLLVDVVITNDLWLSTLFSGIGIGVGLGLVIRSGASTGGMDIPPLALNHYFRVPVSVGMYAFDFVILLGQLFFQDMEMLLYGIALTCIYTVILNKMMIRGTSRTELKIVSKHHDEICEKILEEMDRGVTLLSAKGGYTRDETEVVFSIISNRELPHVEKIIRAIDPEAFIVISRVNEVKGYGFTLNKRYPDAGK